MYYRIIVVILMTFCCFGCGPKLPYEVVKVSGTLTHQGKPLEKFSLVFTPKEPAEGIPSSATTTTGGKFEAFYTDNVKGVQVGKSTVTIAYQGDRDLTSLAPSKVPDEYAALVKKYGFGTQGLEVVIDKSTSSLNIDLP